LSKKDKLKSRLLSRPKDFTWEELTSLLSGMGYKVLKGSGSARKFVDKDKNMISLHEPHPGNILKSYAIDLVVEHLKSKGLL
jgi:hypothetical protein